MKYTSYEIRKKTDRLFAPAVGSCRYTGRLADSVTYIEQAQLLDPALWALFVEQFRIGDADNGDHGWRGEYWGKMMRGACFTYAYTENEELYRVLEDSVRDLLTVQDKFGRIATYSIDSEFHSWDVWSRKYVLLGLQYFLEICRDEDLADAIITAMERHADYMMSKLGSAPGKLRVTDTSKIWDGLNSSSVLEPFVRMYHLTGEKKYLDFAKEIIDEGGSKFFNIFEAVLEGKTYPYQFRVTKAYEMISNFEGIIEYYRATGEEKYKTMAVNFARLVIDSDITVIGSAGTKCEEFDHSRVHQFDPAVTGLMQETCVTVTWMKFCHQMLCLTGDSLYADQIERSAYNGLMGAINVNGHRCRSQVFNFDSYSPLLNGWRGREVGGRKDIVRNQFYWGCCVAIGAAGTGLIPMTAVMPAKDGIAVNLFLNGESTTALPDGTKVTVGIKTEYPSDGDISMAVLPEKPAEFTLSVRIPEWSADTSLSVNGEYVEVSAGSHAMIHRVWTSDDAVSLQLDMRTRIIRATELDPDADEASACHAALQRGPVMLAGDSQLGEDITRAVTLVDENGYALLEDAGEAPIKCDQYWKVKTSDGYYSVVDYASCGQNWDETMPVTVWLTTK